MTAWEKPLRLRISCKVQARPTMHILVIPSWYATPRNPIRGSSFREFGLALYRRGHRVGVFVPPSKFRTRSGLDELTRHWRTSTSHLEIAQDAGLAVYRLPWWGWLPSVFPARRQDQVLTAFDRYCSEQGMPDVIHARSILYGGYVAVCIGQKHGVPVVLTEGSSNYISRALFPDHHSRIRYTLYRTDKILTVGKPLADALKKHYGQNLDIEVMTNSVDTNFFTPPVQPIPDSPFIFLIIARLDKNKAVDLLLKSFARVFRGQHVRLCIVGDGVERKNLEHLADNLGIQTQVEFLGQQPRAAVRDAIQSSHALVSSSYVETFGNTVIEALACGKPVVSTRSGGPDDIISEPTGLLIPSGDVDALAGALHDMVQHYKRYDPAWIRAECVRRFSEDAIMTRLETIYRELTSR